MIALLRIFNLSLLQERLIDCISNGVSLMNIVRWHFVLPPMALYAISP